MMIMIMISERVMISNDNDVIDDRDDDIDDDNDDDDYDNDQWTSDDQ